MVRWNSDEPLELCQGETVKANDLLNRYYGLGHKRSFDLLCQQQDVDLSERQICRYSSNYEWQARVRAQHKIDTQKARHELLELRLQILRDFGLLVNRALHSADVDGSSLSQISGGVKQFVDAFANVFDALPTRRVERVNIESLRFEDILKEYESADVVIDA
jgi:hypothetical protein